MEITLMLGYSDQAHFTRAFKRTGGHRGNTKTDQVLGDQIVRWVSLSLADIHSDRVDVSF